MKMHRKPFPLWLITNHSLLIIEVHFVRRTEKKNHFVIIAARSRARKGQVSNRTATCRTLNSMQKQCELKYNIFDRIKNDTKKKQYDCCCCCSCSFIWISREEKKIKWNKSTENKNQAHTFARANSPLVAIIHFLKYAYTHRQYLELQIPSEYSRHTR